MEILKYFIAALPSLLLILLGISVKYFKAYWLISGYNTMPKEKKANVDVEKLAPYVGNLCFILAGMVLIVAFSFLFDLAVLSFLGILGVILCIIVFLVKAQKFDRNAVDENGKLRRSTKIVIGSVIAFLLLVFAGTGLLLYQGTLAPEYIFSENAVRITGIYGDTIQSGDITDISIIETLPEITMRTNGSDVGGTLKGYFDVTGCGNAKLFLSKTVSPYIILKTKTQTYILNCPNPEKTLALYDSLRGLRGE